MAHIVVHEARILALSAKVVGTDDGRVALLAVRHEASFVPTLLSGRVGRPLAVFVALAEEAGVGVTGGPSHRTEAMGQVIACDDAVENGAGVDVAVLEVESR